MCVMKAERGQRSHPNSQPAGNSGGFAVGVYSHGNLCNFVVAVAKYPTGSRTERFILALGLKGFNLPCEEGREAEAAGSMVAEAPGGLLISGWIRKQRPQAKTEVGLHLQCLSTEVPTSSSKAYTS